MWKWFRRICAGELPPPGAFADVPFAVDEIVMHCLATNPDKRPESCREIRVRLKRALPDVVSIGEQELGAMLVGIMGELPDPSQGRLHHALLAGDSWGGGAPADPVRAVQTMTISAQDEDDHERTVLHSGNTAPTPGWSAGTGLADSASETGPLQAYDSAAPAARSDRPKSRASQRPWYKKRRHTRWLLLIAAVAASMFAGYGLLKVIQ